MSGSHKGCDDVSGKRTSMIVKGGRGGGGRSGSAHIPTGAAACRPGMCPVATRMGVEGTCLLACSFVLLLLSAHSGSSDD